ncbi:MAG: hypothetical protein ACRDRL_08340, partial [Sciscionella sp.]
ARPSKHANDPPGLAAALHRLYVAERRSSTEIGRLLGMSDRLIRNRLAELGIPRRTRGRCHREDRQQVDADRMTRMVLVDDLSALDISRRTGEPYGAVLRTAHELGLPVRLYGDSSPATGPRDIELLCALYSDPQVHDALESHQVLPVAPGAARWQRFPVPVELTKSLLCDLYLDCGLSCHHIELLTGAPRATVRHRLQQHGIPRRPAGGRAPFRRRAGSSMSSTTRCSAGCDCRSCSSRAPTAASTPLRS